MKYTLLMSLGCLPLVVLTVSSAMSLASKETGPAGTGAAAGESPAIEPLIAEVRARAAGDAPFAKKLQETRLFDPAPVELPPPASTAMQSAGEAWNRLQRAGALLAEYRPVGELLAQPAPASLRELEARRERVAALLGRRTTYNDRVRGAGRLFDALAAELAELDGQIASAQWIEGVHQAVADAEEALRDGRYDTCLQLVAAQSQSRPPRADLAKAVAGDWSRLTELETLAKYRRDYAQLDSAAQQAGIALSRRVPPGKADRAVGRQIAAFLDRYPAAPDPADAPRHALLTQRHDEIELEVLLAEFDAFADLPTLLREGAAIVRRAGEVLRDEADRQFYRRRVRERVQQWLRSEEAFLERDEKPKDLLGRQEAVTNDGQRLIGVFYLPRGVNQWRFWRDPKPLRLPEDQGERQYATSSLQQPPATPRYITWAREYNERRRGLIEEGGARADWEDFARRCEEMQEELEQYRERWGVTNPYDAARTNWTFEPNVRLARALIGKWDEYALIVGR